MKSIANFRTDTPDTGRTRELSTLRTRRTRQDGRGVRVQKEPQQLTEDGSGGGAFEDGAPGGYLNARHVSG